VSIDIHTPCEIDPTDAAYQSLLAQLQGNILKSHGRDHVYCLFIAFHDDVNASRDWLKAFCGMSLTSAAQQFAEAVRYRRFGIPGSLFVNVYLSASGYAKLGIAPEQRPADPRFRAGMASAQTALADPPLARWEREYQQPLDALILLADDDETQLLRAARAIRADMRPVASLVAVEAGHVIRNHQGQPLEPFGYADGISQPVFLTADVQRVRARPGGTTQWNPLAPLSLVLTPDGLGGEDAYGSYLVYRKLEQNVYRFYRNVRELAAQFDDAAPDALAGAYAVGRFRNGTPVTLREQPTRKYDAPFNDFTYADDPDGARCPVHAHVRKLNPRIDGWDNGHGVVRRGIPYGARAPLLPNVQHTSHLPDHGVGLLFMCFQRDIAAQFEYLQQTLANDADVPVEGAGCDPLIGASSAVAQQWCKRWGEGGAKVSFRFDEAVTLLGGGYFFAPSLGFFQNL